MPKLRAVAALWAMMITMQENATAITFGTSDQLIPDGKPIGGKPLVTAPTTATPCAEASTEAETMMESTTATTAPGTLGANRLQPTMMISAPAEKAQVAKLALDSEVSQCHCCWNQLPVPLDTPSIPGI